MFKNFALFLILTTILFSCSKNDSKTVVPDTVEEQVVLLEFNSSFTPNANVDLLPSVIFQWSLKNEVASDNIIYELKFGPTQSDLKVLQSNLEEPSFKIESLLDPETTYYWQVSFVNRDGTKTESVVQNFTTSKFQFTDAVLEQIVRDVLEKPNGDFTMEELATLTKIPVDAESDYQAHTPYGGIEDLTGIEYCKNIERVNLFQNGFRSPISDLTPLKNLTSITYLNVANNKVYDLSSLENLSELEYLHLGWNIGVKDITPLANMSKLKGLNLTYTHSLRDISTLRNLTQLDSLSYNHANYIADISPIGDLVNLKLLRFTGSEIITDFDFLKNLTQLERLYLDRNIHINDLSFIAHMPNIKNLGLSNTGISDISMLSEFTAMEFLGLRGLAISDFSVLENMPDLKELHFDDFAIDESILSTQEIRQMFPGVKMIINNTIIYN